MKPPFFPGATVSLSATSSTGRVLLTGAAKRPGGTLRLYNAGAETVFIAFGNDTITAALTSMPIPAGYVEVLSLPDNDAAQWYLAGITASGACTLYATIGNGI